MKGNDYFSRVVNMSINRKKTVRNFRYVDAQSTYRVVKMLRDHFKCGLREAYMRYAEFVCTGVWKIKQEIL